MGENVTLVNMKTYALNRLSVNGDSSVKVTSQNGSANGGVHVNNGGVHVQADKGLSSAMYQNGYIHNKDYGDFDTTTSPTREDAPPLQPARSRPSSARPKEKFIPEHELDIPADGSLQDFTADDMSTFLRYMGVEERIVTHVHKKGLDGHKFSKLKDSDLDGLGMKNPIICHFRDRSIKSKSGSRKKSLPFML